MRDWQNDSLSISLLICRFEYNQASRMIQDFRLGKLGMCSDRFKILTLSEQDKISRYQILLNVSFLKTFVGVQLLFTL